MIKVNYWPIQSLITLRNIVTQSKSSMVLLKYFLFEQVFCDLVDTRFYINLYI